VLLLQGQPHRRAQTGSVQEAKEIAADARLDGTKLQSLRQLHLAAKLRRLAGEDGDTERMIAGDRQR
jgi:hypothetical protein